jgi:arylsulfatase A-like enzyme
MEQGDLETTIHEADSVSRPALLLEAGSNELQLGDLAPGRLDLWLAPALSPANETDDGPDGAGLAAGSGTELSLRGRGLFGFGALREMGSCNLGMPRGTPAWQHCSLDVSESLRGATLHVDSDLPVELAATLLPHNDNAPGPSVFVLVIDTARFDRLKPFNPAAPVGDSLQQLARDSVVFTNTRAPSSWTRPSVATMLSGELPRVHGVADRVDVLGERLPLLQETLAGRGWRTMAWSANPNVLARWGFARGFDYFADTGAQNWVSAKTDARDLLDKVRVAVDEQAGEASFYFVQLMDPHSPYEPGEDSLAAVDRVPGVRRTMPAAESGRRERLAWFKYRKYLGELYDLDRELGRFVEFLKERGLYEESMIVVVSDHGEEFLDHGGLFHGRTLYDEVLRVPLMIKFPHGRYADRRVDAALGLEHLPRLLLAGLASAGQGGESGATPPWDFDPGPQVAELDLDGRRRASITRDGMKLVVNYNAATRQLFDLGKDTLERHDLAGEFPKLLSSLSAELDRMTARERPGWYLAACSSDEPGEMLIEISGYSRPPVGEWLEDGDRIELSEQGVTLARLQLRPREVDKMRFDRLLRVAVSDRDVIYLGEDIPAGLTVTVHGGTAFGLAVGSGTVEERAASFDPRGLEDAARVEPGEPVACEIDGRAPARPYLRLWQRQAVRAGKDESGETIDPALRERLRRLGYSW